MPSDEKVYCSGDDLTANQLGNVRIQPIPTLLQQSHRGRYRLAQELRIYGVADTMVPGALADNTKVYCSGRNDEGQLGNGSTGLTTVPVEVSQSFMPSDIDRILTPAGMKL